MQNVMEGRCWQRGITARGLWHVENGEPTCGDQWGLLRRHQGPRFMRGTECVWVEEISSERAGNLSCVGTSS